MDAVFDFIRRCHERNISLHGFMAVKGSKVVAERYFAPFDENSIHRMFSVSKSFTSLAVGCLASEGLIGLDDKICDRLPEYVDENTHPWIKEMTIRQMLMMSTCHSQTTYKRFEDDDWAKTFFTVRPDHRSGTLFAYDTSSSHVLAKLVEKITGKKMLDYLREQFLDKIGFSKEAYMITDPAGTSQGGSGLMCTLRDAMKVACLLKNGGVYEKEQLIPEVFLKEATVKQIDTDPFSAEDDGAGYGYFFWKTRYKGFAMEGMGSQLFYIFPDLDFAFGVIADTQGLVAGQQLLTDIFYDTLYRWVRPKNWKPYALGNDMPAEEMFGLPKGKPDSLTARRVQGKTAVFEENAMGLKSIRFDFDKKQLHFSMESMDYDLEYETGKWKEFIFPGSDQKAVIAGAWRSENRFLIKIQIIGEDLSPVAIEIGFRTDRAVSVRMKNTSEPKILKNFSGFAGGTCGN
ncbi:MAG: beta-lactamase family protein [Lachnospiraceae bacterium]|nr:beta-lactamase family protein [Lachnospiraceae bacterium]